MTKTGNEKTPVISPEKTKRNNVNKQQNQKRIAKWFSQVGINTTYNNLKTPSFDEKIKRKAKIMAHRKLTNLENILGRALDFCLEDGKEETLDPDWFFSFVNMAEEIFSPIILALRVKIFLRPY